MKTKVKNLLAYAILYFLSILTVILITNNYYLAKDTDNLTNIAYKVDEDLNNGKPSRFDDISVETFSKDEDTASDIKILKEGAPTARIVSNKKISVAIPRYENSQIIGYLRVTGHETDTFFIKTVFVIFASFFYLLWIVQYFIKAKRYEIYQEAIVAKIKAISRNPLEQSYIITEETDPITKELNRLGEKIQQRAESTKPKKENLYEFIELFNFPIFIYNGKGAIKRYNKAFEHDFSKGTSIDMFSSDSDFLSFLVTKLVDPKASKQEFHFGYKRADYLVHLAPIPDLTNNILVSMEEVTNYKKIS
ncbi:hypothetical protein OZX60_05120 [Streptococcaceae bacterium ESL0687]|nr:hypothetical protein OZX60_05120 [Streptococcaceae bacterium ESL0687]